MSNKRLTKDDEKDWDKLVIAWFEADSFASTSAWIVTKDDETDCDKLEIAWSASVSFWSTSACKFAIEVFIVETDEDKEDEVTSSIPLFLKLEASIVPLELIPRFIVKLEESAVLPLIIEAE